MATRDPLEVAIQAVNAAAQRQLAGLVSVSLAEIVYDAYGQLGFGSSKGLLQLIAAIGSTPSRQQQRAMYQRLGELTQAKVLEAYDRDVGNGGLNATGYRAGTGRNARLTGRLRPVLASNASGTIYRIVGAPQSKGGVRIELFDTKVLDRRARHWARINFGAGREAAGETPARFRLSGLGGASVELSLNQGPRPAYRIPKGYWYDSPGGENVAPFRPTPGEAFYLRRQPGGGQFQQQPKITAGHGGAHFLDEGLGAFARALPDEFQEMIRSHLGARSRLKIRFDVTGSSRR